MSTFQTLGKIQRSRNFPKSYHWSRTVANIFVNVLSIFFDTEWWASAFALISVFSQRDAVEFPTAWLLWIVSLWRHMTFFCCPLFSYNLVVRSRSLVRPRLLFLFCFVMITHRWCCVQPYRWIECLVFLFKENWSLLKGSLGIAKW